MNETSMRCSDEFLKIGIRFEPGVWVTKRGRPFNVAGQDSAALVVSGPASRRRHNSKPVPAHQPF